MDAVVNLQRSPYGKVSQTFPLKEKRMAVFLPDIWACIPDTERAAARAMMAPSLIPPAFTPAFVIDAIFDAQTQIEPTLRRQTWERVYRIERVTIEFEGEEVEGYFSNRQWCVDVWNCNAQDECPQAVERCLIFNFVNQP